MNIRKALGVSAVAQVVTFVLSFVNVVVVARLLTPEEIGVFSVAVSTLGIAHVFREFGVSQYLVQAREVGKVQFRAAFTLTLMGSWSIAAVLYLSRGLLADIYDHEGIAEVLKLMALNFLILPFGTPLLAMLRRELRFGTLSGLKIANSAASTIVTITAAMAGESYLSMAWGALAGHLSNVIILNFIRPGQILMLPTTTGLREIFRFGSIASLITLLGELGSASHGLIMGKTLGFSDVAYYSRAAGLRDMFLWQLYTLVKGVHFPTFSERVRKGENAALLYRNAVRHLTAITIPAMALLAVLSEPLIRFFFGTQWDRSAPLASMLCVFAIFMTPYSLGNLSLIAAGHIDRVLKIEISVQTLRVLALVSSVWLTLEQVVPVLGLVFLIEAAIYQASLTKFFDLDLVTMFKEIQKSLLLIPFTITAPLLVAYMLPVGKTSTSDIFITLATSGILACAGWLLGLRLMKHPLGDEIVSLGRKLSRKT